LDEEFQALSDALRDRKADTIFTAVADRLSKEGMNLLDSTLLLKKYMALKHIDKIAPTTDQLKDIELASPLPSSWRIDVGQTVVVKDRAIVAIEAMEGTDRTIARGGEIARSGAVVVKPRNLNRIIGLMFW